MNKRRRHLLRLVAKQAATQIPYLPAQERAELLDGLALLLSGDEAKQCEHAAWLIRKSEAAQLEFSTLMDAI